MRDVPQIVVLSAELERRFELDELKQLCEELLGLDPEEIPGASAKGSFARALAEKCAASYRAAALCDAMAAFKEGVDPHVLERARHGLAEPNDAIEAGDSLGPFLVLRRLGSGRLGTVYQARKEGGDVRLKVLHRSATYDRVGLYRFLTASRIAGTLSHPGLPENVTAGEIDGRFYVAHTAVEGQTIASRMIKTGAMHIEEARGILEGLIDALSALHARRIAHGAIRAENVLLTEGGGVLLLDAGSHFLTAPHAAANGKSDRLGALGSYKTLSPEQIEGKLADPRSDLYSLGALLYELLTGRPVFPAKNAAEALMAHLTRDPQLPSLVAPAGWVGPDVDDFVLSLMTRDPQKRPRDATAIRDSVATLGTAPASPEGHISEEELDERIRELLADPSDEMAEEALVSALRAGADPLRVADTFRMASELLEGEWGGAAEGARVRLLRRAAKIFDTTLKQPELAEPLYDKLSELAPDDEETAATLERLRRKLGKHEEIVESLLARAERAQGREEKAKVFGEIGRLYALDLGDREQALVAYTQAFCEAPETADYAREIEQLAGKSVDSWNDVLSSCLEASSNDDLPQSAVYALTCQMGSWYLEQVGRADLAIGCYSAILANDPVHGPALAGLAEVYRRTQSWADLANVLSAQAGAPSTSAPEARDLRVETAEILETRLGAVEPARDLLETVLREDPSHERAAEALARVYERTGDFASYVKALEARARALHGEREVETLFKIGEIYELHLGDIPEATRRYRSAVARNPKHLEALQGLDRCLSQAGDFDDLVDVLHLQIEAVATPRQKAHLWERIAAVWDEEFLNHEKAAEAWENVLDVDATHDGALTNLVRHYRALERFNDVVIALERHIELLEKDPSRKLEKLLALGRVLGENLRVPERAIQAFEKALAIDPQNAEALESLAGLRVQTGEVYQALFALEKLAREATTPSARAEQYVRAAQLLESHGDQDGAIERYKLAVDANPTDRTVSAILRAAYIARGDHSAAAELLELEIKGTEGQSARAKLAGELSALYHDRVQNDVRAESWAKVALDADPTNLDALRVLGDVAYSAGRPLEAARHYEQVANRTDALTQPEAVRVLSAYIDCLLKNGQEKRAVSVGERLAKLAPEDPKTIGKVAELFFEHGEAQDSYELSWQYLQLAKDELQPRERAVALYRLGESARRAGDLVAALPPLEEAAEIDPSATPPLRSLALLFGAKKQWEQVIHTMYRQLENETGDGRVALLLEIGDLAARELKDPSYAAKSYLAALSEKPNDRKILAKLMQLYSEEKDWDRLVKVILKLADFVDDHRQKSKYVHTAGRIAYKEMGDVRRASQLMQRALELDPDNADILKEGLDVHAKAQNAEAMKELLKRQVKVASDANDKPAMLAALNALAELYLHHFKRLEQAIAVYEGAQEVENTVERREILAVLYASDPRYTDKAIAAQAEILERDPFRPEAHRTLRRLYTESKRPDPAWCCCQALHVLGQADADEARFFLRMRNENGAAPKSRLTENDFHAHLVHRHADPLLTALFALIQPAIIAMRSKPVRDSGFGPEHVVDPSQHQFAAAQTIPYVADVLGQPCPPMLQNPNDYGELSILHAQPPVIVLGTSVVGVALPPQTMMFMAARHLTFYRPGFYVQKLVPTSAGLKAWLFAAIRLMVPQFPIPNDVAAPVQEAYRALEKAIVGPQRDHLARVVSKLLHDGAALDLRKWSVAVELTADRAGFAMCDDLQAAVEMIRASDPNSSSISIDERVEEIFRYGVSEQYFAARQTLGISIDA